MKRREQENSPHDFEITDQTIAEPRRDRDTLEPTGESVKAKK